MELLNLKNDFLQIKEEDYPAIIAKYNMTDKMVRESMDTIRQWYKTQHHLPEKGLPDDRLFRHLYTVGFSLEKAKRTIDNMLTSRTMIPDLMSRRDPTSEWVKRIRQQVLWAVVPQRLDDMTRISVCSFTGLELPDPNTWEIFKYSFLVGDYRMCTDVSTGDHIVIDYKNMRLGHVARVTPTVIKQAIFIIQSCFGSKVKGIYFINIPVYGEFILSIFKASLSKKIAGRLHCYKDYESLHKDLPKKLLPADMGGLNKTIQELADDTYAAISEPYWRDWFIAQDSIITDESKRISLESDMSSVLLGIHGSFRKLDLD